MFSIRLGILACLAALALAGCGRKGPLELPTSAPQSQSPVAAQDAQTRVFQKGEDDPGLLQDPNLAYEESPIAKLNSQVKNPARPINAPPIQQPSTFILDPLVK